MNLKEVKKTKIADVAKELQTDELKMKIYRQIEKFVYKNQVHYYPHFKGDKHDLVVDLFTKFIEPKKHRNGELFSELDRVDPGKVGGQEWTGDDDKAIATYVQRYVNARLIDLERTDKQEVSASENYDENNPGLTFDRAAAGRKNQYTDDDDDTDGDPYEENINNQIYDLMYNPQAIKSAKKMLLNNPEQVKRIQRLAKHYDDKLDLEVKEFIKKLIGEEEEPEEKVATPSEARKDVENLLGESVKISNYQLQKKPAVKVTFPDKDAMSAAEDNKSKVIKLMKSDGYEFYKAHGTNWYFFKNDQVTDSRASDDAKSVERFNALISRVGDAFDARLRQLQRSLEVWKKRLEDNPNDKKIKAMVEARLKDIENLQLTPAETKKEVKNLTEDVPTIKNANDLYKYAESLGLDIKGSNGKPLGTEQIKAKIAQVLWDKQHPGEEMPPQISPMLIKDITGEGKEYVDKTFKKEEWVLQNKINGQRFILTLNPDGSTHMTSRDRSVKTFRYSELDDHVLGLLNLKSPFEKRTILDGEIICDIAEIDLPSGVHTTSTLQSTVALMHMNSKDSLEFQRKNGFSLRYKVFDILMLDGKNVEDEPYDTRKELTVTACEAIKKLNPDCAIDILPTIEDYESAWDEFEKYVSQGGEGLILKNRKGKYEQGKRTKGQWKLKGRLTIDAFITGSVPASEDKSLKDYIGGFKFSTNYHGKQVEIAAVSNIDMATRKAATIYDENGKPQLNPDWLGKCAELTAQNFKEGSLRLGSARINEWRDDKNPEDCVLQDEMIRYDK